MSEEIRHVVVGVGVGGVGGVGVGVGGVGAFVIGRGVEGILLLRVVVFVLVIVGASGGALRLPALLETRALGFLLLRLEREVFHLRQVEHAGVLEELGGEVALALAAAARVAVRRLDRLLVVRVRVLVVRGDVVLDTLAEGLPLGRLVVVLAGGRLGELEQAVGAHRVALLHGGAEALQRRLRLAEQRLELHLDLHPHLLGVETLGVELGEGEVHTLRRDAGGQAREERAGRIARRRRSLHAGGEKRRRAGAERAPELVQRVSAGGGRRRPVSVGCHVALTSPAPRSTSLPRARLGLPSRATRKTFFPGAGGVQRGCRRKTFQSA